MPLQVNTAMESGKETQKEESLGQRALQSPGPGAEPKLALEKLKEKSGTAWVSENSANFRVLCIHAGKVFPWLIL